MAINETRSTAHWARVRDRRAALRRLCAAILPPAARFVWEVGCGHGHFLTAYAAAHPEELCLGVDSCRERIDRGQRKQRRARLPNLHFILADAADFLDCLPPEAGFRAVYMLFPDPWPKRRHRKHRLLQADFASAVASRAGEGTRFHFRSDDEACFRDARAVVSAHPGWRLVDEPWPFEVPTVFQERAATYHSWIAARTGQPVESAVLVRAPAEIGLAATLSS